MAARKRREPKAVKALIQKHGVENPLIAFVKAIRAEIDERNKNSGGGTRRQPRK